MHQLAVAAWMLLVLLPMLHFKQQPDWPSTDCIFFLLAA
jgi:hypothetical protein